jgi:predicted O-methyltransferase YrrM
LKTLLDYLIFWFSASNAHGLHSPFVFQLYNQVIASDKEYYCFREIEELRWQLSLDKTYLEINDLGAGSKVLTSHQRSISQIINTSTSEPKVAQLIFKLIDFFQPQTILELGTCLGLTTLYMYEAMPSKSIIYTFEGSKELAEKAESIATQYIKNKVEQTEKKIKTVIGNLDETLLKTITEVDKLDFVFFDANHRQAPTLQYFEICLAKAHENSVFVFDDIYWSMEMKAAWQQIQAHPRVKVTVDLFALGLVFFTEKQAKQHFKLKR